MTTTLDQIRSDLKTLRLYYANQEQCDNLFRFIPHKVTELVQTYSEMIKTASLDLYLLYCELYVNGSTQESAAEQFDFSTEYVRRRNKVLLEYFQSRLEEKKEDRGMTREKFLAYCRSYNTYRTKKYIVAQRIGWVTDDINGNYTLGIDYRFRRTPELDAIYDECFAVRQNPEGVRLKMDESIVKQMN